MVSAFFSRARVICTEKGREKEQKRGSSPNYERMDIRKRSFAECQAVYREGNHSTAERPLRSTRYATPLSRWPPHRQQQNRRSQLCALSSPIYRASVSSSPGSSEKRGSRKPALTLARLLSRQQDRPCKEQHQGVVYKLSCSECPRVVCKMSCSE